tara:strand:+ start:150 stop:314 length:165 start_codon:yes stop_codon:yes gene_type:complete
MKIEKMTKRQLLLAIEKADQNLSDPKWVRNNSKFMVGAIFVHRSKLKEALITRG